MTCPDAGSVTSPIAWPLISRATSDSDGFNGLCVRPAHVQDRIGELAALLLIQVADVHEDLREDVLVQPRIARHRQRGILPLQPARRVGEAPVLLRKPGARQTIDRRLDLLHLVRRRAGRPPELARLVRIDFADHQPVGLLQCLDVLSAYRGRSARRSCRSQTSP